MQDAPERFVGDGRRIQPGPAQALHCRLQIVRLETDAQASGRKQLSAMGVQVKREAVSGQLGSAAPTPAHTESVHFRNIQKCAGCSSNSRNPYWVVLVPPGKIR